MDLETYFISNESTLAERVQFLKKSPFFGEFLESEIKNIAQLMVRREYEPNELIYDQNEHTKGVFILIQGEVSIRRLEGNSYLEFRSISTPGYIFGWSSAFDSTDICLHFTEDLCLLYSTYGSI